MLLSVHIRRYRKHYTGKFVGGTDLPPVMKQSTQLISGFHRTLLQLITFISRLNALDYTKLRS